jgi:hypothetical protein
MLSLFEELFLLDIDEDQGAIVAQTKRKLRFGLAGAVLAELVLQGKVQSDQKGRLEIANPEPLGNEILDRALDEIKDSKRERKINYWVGALAAKQNKLRKKTADRLESDGVIHQQDGRMEWVIPAPDCPSSNASVKYCLKSKLREAVLTETEPDLHSLALLDLARASGLLNLIFTKDERQAARQRIYELMVGEGLRNNTALEIEEISQAVNNQAGS